MSKHKLNGKSEGCYLCGSLDNMTEHHIRKGGFTLSVYICWKHHQIIHGVGLGKLNEDGSFFYPSEDILMVLKHGSEYRLFKYGETKEVRRKLSEELRRRKEDK